MGILLKLAALSAWSRRASLLLLTLSVMASSVLLLGIDLARQSARDTFSNAVSGTDLVVGAQNSPVALLLYSVFRIGEPARNMPFEAFKQIQADPRVKSALPIALGDSYRGYPVVGTTSAYFFDFQYGARQHLALAQGRAFDDYTVGDPVDRIFEAVLGADVAARMNHKVGDAIALHHGMSLQTGEPSHGDKPFTVVGVLQPTGTPVDQSVHISLAGMEAIHLDWQAGVPMAGANIPAELVAKFNLTPKSITATLVSLHNRAGVFRVQRELENQPGVALSAILPGVALSTLWQTVGLVEQVLLLVAALVGLVSVLGLTSVMLVTLGQRRRELAVLRSTGAGPVTIFSLVLLESALVMWLGAALGVLAAAASAWALGPWVLSNFGVQLSAVWGLQQGLLAVLAFAAFGSMLGAWPAWRAYRLQLQDGLSMRGQ
ncbi:ABC transporter permease [Limnobacter sp.]|uniref:ABC transporter permease n=1 Tax=Limnobacter sp. TaxID=2003368 RepID=UPI003517B69A